MIAAAVLLLGLSIEHSASFEVGAGPAAFRRTNRGCFIELCGKKADAQVVPAAATRLRMGDDWSGFSALDDDDDYDDIAMPGGGIDTTEYAKEEDPQEVKAEVGSSLEPPSIDRPAEPIFLPAGT